MNKLQTIIFSLAVLMLCACSSDDGQTSEVTVRKGLTITSSIECFDGEALSRSNVNGDAFATGDLVSLKIICPFSSETQIGESTWGNTYDSFWLLRWDGTSWKTMTSAEHFDVSGSYGYSGSSDIFSYYEAQATPYVFTAMSWTEERLFRDKNNTLVGQYCHVFHHDQSREKNYVASDLLWAQQFSQTGPQNIHLTFNHMLSCLVITIDDDALTNKISSNAILTLEGMPNIDQQEIVVGNYYAEASKTNSSYGYRQKASCSYENNGKVLGIASIDETQKHAVVHPFTGGIATIGGLYSKGSVIANTGTYTCHPVGNKTYRLIVPPCVLTANATFWLRDDSRRYKMTLERKEFVQGHLYNVTMKLQDNSNSTSTDD